MSVYVGKDVQITLQIPVEEEITHKLLDLYKKAIEILPQIQVKASYGFDHKNVFGTPYDFSFILEWESGYFCRSFLKGYLNLNFDIKVLNDELQDLAYKASQIKPWFFLYYDFQSKNIMIKDRKLRFIDFQGGRLGPLHYDLASLILDPYVNINQNMRDKLIEYYLNQIDKIIPLDKSRFLKDYPYIAIHRIMQMLGAFAFLSKVKKKWYFADYIPIAVQNLKHILKLDVFLPYKKLRNLVNKL